MVVCSLVGGVIGFLVGELILARLSAELPQWLLMGLYFGQYSFFVGLMCLIAEMVSPRLNGLGWKQRYAGFSWKMLVPGTFVMVGVAAMLLQFVYGFHFQWAGSADRIALLLDTSNSMEQTDPNNQLFQAAADMVRKMDDDMEVAVITFNDQTDVLQPLVKLSDQAVKDAVVQKLLNHPKPGGGTQIERALQTAYDQLQATLHPENSTVVLMSDGYSNVDLNKSLAPFKNSRIVVHTVGMSAVDADGTYLLKRIAEETGGSYFDVEHADQMTGVFGQIYDMSRQDRNLVSERTGAAENSLVYAILRLVSFIVIGGLVGLALGFIFDNRHLAKSFTIGGAVSGLLAGLLLETGLSSVHFLDILLRLLACALMAVVLTLFTVFIPVPASSGHSSFQARLSRGKPRASDSGQQSSKRFDL